MQHHVALLAGGLQVRQALPVHQVPGAGDAGGGRRGGEVSLGRMVLAFYAENAVDPAVLVGGKAHVIDIGGGFSPLGHGDGTGPEAEVVHAVRALGHGKEGFSVIALHADHHHVLALPLDGAAVERGMHAQALHQVGIRRLVQVVTPFQGSMLRREDGILVTLVYAVSFNREVLLLYQLAVAVSEPLQTFFKSHKSSLTKVFYPEPRML